ncbi:MAG: OmpA family protein [Phycisphaera sp.]|nr:OmpA family protein [Phycisphaera sp.]
MNAWCKWTVVVVLASMGFGCVAQSERDALQDSLRRSEEQVIELKSRLESCQALVAQLQAARGSDSALDQRLADAQAQVAEYQRKLADLEDRIRRLGVGGPVDAVTDQALVELAEMHPGLMTYDPQRGMIKLASDLTFALGSTNVNDEAKRGLSELARIFNTPAAGKYEVRIVGHTDNVPVTSATGRQKYGDNWGLSAFRAISVMQVLKGAGVNETRMGIGGYGEFRPVVANPTGRGKGAEPNRRVEIYLVPMPDLGVAPAPSTAPAPAAPDTTGGPVIREQDSPALYK